MATAQQLPDPEDGPERGRDARDRLAMAVIDLIGMLAILATTVVLVSGNLAAGVLAAASGFIGVALRLWLRRRR